MASGCKSLSQMSKVYKTVSVFQGGRICRKAACSTFSSDVLSATQYHVHHKLHKLSNTSYSMKKEIMCLAYPRCFGDLCLGFYALHISVLWYLGHSSGEPHLEARSFISVGDTLVTSVVEPFQGLGVLQRSCYTVFSQDSWSQLRFLSSCNNELHVQEQGNLCQDHVGKKMLSLPFKGWRSLGDQLRWLEVQCYHLIYWQVLSFCLMKS